MTRLVGDSINWAGFGQLGQALAGIGQQVAANRQEVQRRSEFDEKREDNQFRRNMLQEDLADRRAVREQALADKEAEKNRLLDSRANQATHQQLSILSKINNPQIFQTAYASIREKLRPVLEATGRSLEDQLPSDITAEHLPGMLRDTRVEMKRNLDPKVYLKDQRIAADLMAADLGDASIAGNVPAARALPGWGKYIRLAIEGGTPKTILNVDNREVGRKSQGALEEDIFGGEQTLGLLDDLEDIAMEAGGLAEVTGLKSRLLLGGGEAIDEGLRLFGSKLSNFTDSDFARVQELRAAFRSSLDAFSARLFTKAIGAAQTKAEFDRNKRGILNSGMGTVQFKAAMATLRRTTKRNVIIAQDILREGLDVSTDEGKLKFGKELDRRTVIARRKEERMAGIMRRLREQGKTREEAEQIMRSGVSDGG